MYKVALVAGLMVALTFGVFAAEAAKPAAKDVKAEVTGKVAVKTEKVDGKDVKVVTIAVAEAKVEPADAKVDLKGKTLKVVGAKCADVEKLADKEVVAKGTLKADNKEIDVTEVKEKPKAPEKK